MDISAQLKKLRLDRGMTQQDVADAVGVTKVAVGQWENNKSIPRRENMDALSRLFGISIPELLGGDAPAADLPVGAMPITGDSNTIPMRRLGKTHAGEPAEELFVDSLIQVPRRIAEFHPHGFALTVEGDCMDRCYPEGCVVVVDPDLSPWSGCDVVAEITPGESVLRRYMKGNSTLMLVADSHSDGYEDMIFTDADVQEIKLVGVVVWFQADHDVTEKW